MSARVSHEDAPGTAEAPEGVSLVLPLPPRELHPNARPYHMAKARKTREYRRLAWAKAREQGPGPQWERAVARATFYHETQRARDADGALSSLKAAFDGIADAGVVVNDSGLVHEPVCFEIDRDRPRVEILITPVEP